MKTKRTVEMTLPQLIEWAWENDVTFQHFLSNKYRSVVFEENGKIIIDNITFDKNDTFQVEIEEDVTENTKLDLVEVFEFDDGDIDIFYKRQCTIREILDLENNFNAEGKAKYFYMLNKDGSIGQMIWKDGEMVG
jgi:uncharacterized protein YkuJ